MADVREVERERRFADAEPAHRDREHLDDKRNGHHDREVRDGQTQVQRVGHGQVEHDHRRLHEHRAAETGGQRARLRPKASEPAGELLDAAADPFPMEHGQRLEQASEPGRRKDRKRRPGRDDEKTGPEPDRQNRHGEGMDRRCVAVAQRGHEDERHEPEAPVHQYDRRGQRLRAGGPGGVADADDVAADVARQKIVRERRDQKRPEQPAPGHPHVLCLEQDMPAPCAGDHVQGVERQRHGEPWNRRASRQRPQLPRVDPREEQDQQSQADGNLERQEDVATNGGRVFRIRGHASERDSPLYYGFVRKLPEPCAF